MLPGTPHSLECCRGLHGAQEAEQKVKRWPIGVGFEPGIERAAAVHSWLVDSAISHCEKLRRVLELESWIRDAHDCPILARALERWQAERDELVAELDL
jgi:hypothetical protein